MEVAVVHEWIDAYAGSEQVFEALAQEFPAADLFALSHTPGVCLDVGGRPIATTALDRPRLRDRRELTLPLMPLVWRGFGSRDYDLVISSSHAFAHANRLARPGGVHLSYVHSPARYLWSADVDSRGASPLLAPARSLLRAVDVQISRQVTGYSANSSAVAARIADFWGREATVIHPPVRVEYFGAAAGVADRGRGYVLGVGRWIPYKNHDLVIRAGELARMPVKIAGRGPDRERLVALAAAATVPVEIIEAPSDAELRELYAGASCLVFPTVEDFGMVPVEAQAAGTPVVSVRAGGALDTVLDGVSGILVKNLEPESLAAGIERATRLTPADCTASAQRFSRGEFGRRVHAWVDAALDAQPAAG